MLNQLFKRMAPLVAGVMIFGQAIPLVGAYPQITSFQYVTSYDVALTTSGGPFPTFWFLNQNHNSSYNGDYSVNTYPGVTNIAVYVYNEYPGAYYSYAIIDSVQGTTIWNGP